MTNRDKLLQTSEYDLLCMMQENIDRANIDGETPCIMVALGEPDRHTFCRLYGINCERCVKDWLNREAK